MRSTVAALLLVAAGGFVSVAADPPSAPATKPAISPVPTLELAVVSGDKLGRIAFDVEVDGRPLATIWDETYSKLLAFYDRNGDGTLDEKEAARLPSAFSLRQLLWGQSVPYAGPTVAWKELDRDGNGKATTAELAAFYGRGGLGGVLVGVGRPQATEALTAALLKALDTDGNGTVTEAEWKAAPEVLRKYDRNDDELIGPGELVPKVAYPGTLGAILAPSPTLKVAPVPELDGLPVIVLPTDTADTHWATAAIARRDANKDGKLDAKEAGLAPDVFAKLDTDKSTTLDAKELLGWRGGEAALRFTLRLGKRASSQAALSAVGKEFDTGMLRFDIRPDEGKMPELVATARKRLQDRFTDADANADDFLIVSETTKREHAELKQLIAVADCDGDGKLSRKEMVAWLDLQDQVATGHVLLTVLDHGAGLFELLDADHDGSLSVPELRKVHERVKTNGCLASDGSFDAKKLPRQLILTVSRGHPLNVLSSARRDGPTWFKAMDRNGDGYVSRREFTGPADLFDKLDLDKDGFLNPEEAAKAKK